MNVEWKTNLRKNELESVKQFAQIPRSFDEMIIEDGEVPQGFCSASDDAVLRASVMLC